MASSTVLYPKGVNFDMDYYLKTHMPLVQEKWGPEGLTAWTITELPDDADYKIQALLTWESMDKLKAATSGPTAKVVFGDVPNFANKQPLVLSGAIVKSS